MKNSKDVSTLSKNCLILSPMKHWQSVRIILIIAVSIHTKNEVCNQLKNYIIHCLLDTEESNEYAMVVLHDRKIVRRPNK